MSPSLVSNAGFVNAEIKTSDKLQTAGEVTFAPIDITAFVDVLEQSFRIHVRPGRTGKGFALEEVQLTADKEPKVRISLLVPLSGGGLCPAPRRFETRRLKATPPTMSVRAVIVLAVIGAWPVALAGGYWEGKNVAPPPSVTAFQARGCAA